MKFKYHNLPTGGSILPNGGNVWYISLFDCSLERVHFYGKWIEWRLFLFGRVPEKWMWKPVYWRKYTWRLTSNDHVS